MIVSLVERWRTGWTLLAERVGQRVPLVQQRPELLAWSVGGGLAGLLLIVAFSLLPSQRPADAHSIADGQRRICCAACGYDAAHTLDEMRTWQRPDAGGYACPACAAPRAESVRPGGLRVIRPRPADESRTPPSDG